MAIVEPVLEDWLEGLRREGEAFERALSATHLANLRGLTADAPLSTLFDEHPTLSSRSTFERLQEHLEACSDSTTASAAPGADETTEREVAQLLEFVGTSLERRSTAAIVAKRLALETTLTVDIDRGGDSIPYRSLPAAIRSCPDRNQREALERAYAAAREKVSTLVVEAHQRAQDAAAAIGEEDYVRWRSRLARFDIDELARSAERILDATDDMADDAAKWLFKDGVELARRESLRSHDLLWAMRAADLDSLLAPEELWRVDSFLEKLGLDPHGGGRIIRDTASRPGKSGRAFCVPLEVPDEVYLVLPPTRGLPQWRSLLHELGHAIHHANIDRHRPFEHRYLGDTSVTEGYAMVFDHLLLNPVWARRVLKLSREKADRLVKTAASVALMITRRNTAKLLHEIAYHRGVPEAPELYEELLRRASGVMPLTAGHLTEVDPELYSARYVRAWIFEGLAHRELRERFDEDWFVNPRAGAYMASLFSQGQARDLHEIASDEFGTSLDPELIVRRFEEVL